MKVHVYSKYRKWWSLRHGSRAGNGTALTLRHATSRIGLKHESEWLKSIILVKSNNNWQVVLASLRSPLHDISRKFVFSPRCVSFISILRRLLSVISRLSYPVRSRIKIHDSLISSGKNNCDIDPRRKNKAILKKRKLDLKQQRMIAALNMR